MSIQQLAHKALVANSIPLPMKHWDVRQKQQESKERLAGFRAIAQNLDNTYRKLSGVK
ncbi:hypothetical protein [Gracilimonas sediminicola]|uniref:Uncharacterized protein n=1 Tax=Gracilimonas sediminicola TaxID=2952158 RepID=A0A9X2L0K1_9BACT|nr:hypothetical protein [Gracilimonas sediminicola]MCP9290044.1 hypothetical protein [Gracilimonas sediminicola]